MSSKREQILDTFAALQREQGEHRNSWKISELAEKSGVSRMTIYRHFKNKQELVACFQRERGGRQASPTSTKEQILQGARRVFVRQGFGATMEQIAQEAQVGVATVYRQFGDKDTLIRAFRDRLRPTIAFEQLEKALQQEELALEEQLIQFAENVLEHIRRHRDVMIVGIRDRLQGQAPQGLQETSGIHFRRLQEFFARQVADEVLDGDPAELVIGFFGMLFAHAFLIPGVKVIPAFDSQTSARSIVRIFLSGTQKHAQNERRSS